MAVFRLHRREWEKGSHSVNASAALLVTSKTKTMTLSTAPLLSKTKTTPKSRTHEDDAENEVEDGQEDEVFDNKGKRKRSDQDEGGSEDSDTETLSLMSLKPGSKSTSRGKGKSIGKAKDKSKVLLDPGTSGGGRKERKSTGISSGLSTIVTVRDPTGRKRGGGEAVRGQGRSSISFDGRQKQKTQTQWWKELGSGSSAKA